EIAPIHVLTLRVRETSEISRHGLPERGPVQHFDRAREPDADTEFPEPLVRGGRVIPGCIENRIQTLQALGDKGNLLRREEIKVEDPEPNPDRVLLRASLARLELDRGEHRARFFFRDVEM